MQSNADINNNADTNNNNNKHSNNKQSSYTALNSVQRDFLKHILVAHMLIQIPTYMNILTIHNLQRTLTDNKQGTEVEEDSSVEQKTWQVYCSGEKSRGQI